MEKSTTKWKPGQIVTIRGERYRIVKDSDCKSCAFDDKWMCTHPCRECVFHKLIPVDCAFRKLDPKS